MFITLEEPQTWLFSPKFDADFCLVSYFYIEKRKTIKD